MLAEVVGDVIGELDRLRLGHTSLVSADRREARSRAEVEGGKGMSERMLADVDAPLPGRDSDVECASAAAPSMGKLTLVMTL